MKFFSKEVFPLSAVGLTAVAHAQSSVTLYGLVDESVQYVHNVAQPDGKNGNKIGLYAGNIQGDRFGLRGVEDLGGGLQALFQLENGFGRCRAPNSARSSRQCSLRLRWVRSNYRIAPGDRIPVRTIRRQIGRGHHGVRRMARVDRSSERGNGA